MIVEPAPTNPRSPARRTLRLVGVAVPVVLLVGIVAAGALGPQRRRSASPDPSALRRRRRARVDADAAARSSPTARRRRSPTTWIGFRVRSVAETRAERPGRRRGGDPRRRRVPQLRRPAVDLRRRLPRRNGCLRWPGAAGGRRRAADGRQRRRVRRDRSAPPSDLRAGRPWADARPGGPASRAASRSRWSCSAATPNRPASRAARRRATAARRSPWSGSCGSRASRGA